MITSYHIAILKAVATFYTLTRVMIQSLCCPNDKNGRVTRKRIQQLVQLGLLNKTRMEVVNPASREGATPVYFPSRKGLELLACELEDESWLDCCTQTPNWQHLLHWVTVASFHILVRQAIGLQIEASLAGWLGEWDTANLKEREPHKRYRLYTLLSEKPRLICNPDAAFLLRVSQYAKIHYVEIDRGTSGIQQIAHSKTPGYAALAEKKLHGRHFATNTDSFFVLNVSPSAQRRDLLRKAIADKRGAGLWKFAAWPDLTPESLLYGPVWYRCEGDGQPLIRTVSGASPATIDRSVSGPEAVPVGIRQGSPMKEVAI